MNQSPGPVLPDDRGSRCSARFDQKRIPAERRLLNESLQERRLPNSRLLPSGVKMGQPLAPSGVQMG
jgi:hypothetical protein